MPSSLPGEIIQEILVRLPANEPENLVHASFVCKAWRRVLIGDQADCFLRRRREFHGVLLLPPPLIGYIQNPCYNGLSPMRFVHTATTTTFVDSSPPPVITTPAAAECSGWCAFDCRHGRVLIHTKGDDHDPSNRLIVWDPITGSQQHLSNGSHPSYRRRNAGAVLCAMEGCDHLDCHGGLFDVVLVEAKCAGPQFTIDATKYSSLTGAWGAPTSNVISYDTTKHAVCSGNDGKHNLLIGDALHFLYEYGQSVIIKYDLHAHRLSEIRLPRDLYGAILMKAEDGGLGLAILKDNCVYLWSRRQVDPKVIGWRSMEYRNHGWVESRFIELGTLVPRRVPFESYKVIGFAEGTNTIFINISAGIFTLDLESNKVRKVGQREADRVDPVLPYMSFYVPR